MDTKNNVVVMRILDGARRYLSDGEQGLWVCSPADACVYSHDEGEAMVELLARLSTQGAFRTRLLGCVL